MEINVGSKTAILFGSTGLVGRHCLDFLLSHQAYTKVLVFNRRKVDIQHEKLEQILIDFNRLEDMSRFIKGDDIFIALGTTAKKAGSKEAFYKVDFKYVHDVAQIARNNGVNQMFFVSSVGADTSSAFFYIRVKGEIEESLKSLKFWSTHIFRPSLLLGHRNENRFGEKIAQIIGAGLDFVLRGLLTKYKPVEADVVAKAMVNSAQILKEGVHIHTSDQLQKLASIEDALRNR